MTFDYTSGNPTHLSGAQQALMSDLQGSFNDLRTYINSTILPQLAQNQLYVGEVRFIAVAAAPALWLPANGAAISRATYSVLFAAIGTTYGVGDNVNTFNVPPVAGRSLIGSGTGSGLTARTAGSQVGQENVQLTTAQMPSHTHSGLFAWGPTGYSLAGPGGVVNGVSASSIGVGSTGGDQAHTNMQPSLVVPAYIYAGQ